MTVSKAPEHLQRSTTSRRVLATAGFVALCGVLVASLFAAASPAAAQESFECSYTDGVLTWTDDGAEEYYAWAYVPNIRTYLGGHATTGLAVAPADSYRVTYWQGPVSTVAICPGPSSVDFNCSYGDGLLSWDDAGAEKYHVFGFERVSWVYLGAHSGTSLHVSVYDAYRVTHWRDGSSSRARCGGAPFTCAYADGQVTWADHNADRYYVQEFDPDAGIGTGITYLGSTTTNSFQRQAARDRLSYWVTYWVGSKNSRAVCDV